METNDNLNRIIEMNTEAERRQIAAMAMQGLLASPPYSYIQSKDPGEIADYAVRCADALIKELNKKKDGC